MKLNFQQSQIKNHSSGPLLVLAGAGTGKTTTIVQRMVFLISEKNKIHKIWRKVKVKGHVEEVIKSSKELLNI